MPFIYYIFFGEGGGVNFEKEKDWIIKSFSKVTATIYESLCSSLHIIIIAYYHVFNTISGKIIEQAVVSTVMLSEN